MRTLWLPLVGIALWSTACESDDQSPHGIARKISGLTVGPSSDVVEHDESWNDFNGDGEAWIVIQLNDSTFREAIEQSKEAGYKRIDETDSGFRDVVMRSRGVTNGVYRMQPGGSPFSYSLAVLDERTRRLVIRIVET